MRLGYNTNGLTDHNCEQALTLLSEIGYQSVALTIDHDLLNPFATEFPQQLVSVKKLLDDLNLKCVIETGARYLLNPHVKHEPTLLSAEPKERSRRIAFLKHCIDIAAELDSRIVSCWSGVLCDPISRKEAFSRLVEGCRIVLDYADLVNIRIAFEPEPGMLINTMQSYAELSEQLDAKHFGLTMDIGHLHCLESEPISHYLQKWAPCIWNVHIEDMVKNVHEHLPFGAGEIDFAPVLKTLSETGYSGGLHVELSRHSHVGPEMAQQSFTFLKQILEENIHS